MGKTLATHLSDVRTDLKDPSTLWSDAELTRALTRAYADLSRFLPRELYYEQRLSFTVTAESVTTAAAHGTYKALANKPIRYESDVVTNAAGTVTYTRNTDYVVDYMNGQITTVSGGSMVVLTIYKISYTKSKIAVDMTSLTPMRIGAVEYPAHSIPKMTVSAELYGDVLTVMCGEDTQEEMSLNKHILVQYYVPHTVPATAVGTCPAFLDETVNLATAAYALFQKATQHEHQAVTDLASARTALGNIAAIHTLADAALDKNTTYYTDVDTALDAVKTNADLAATALTAVKTNTDLAVASIGAIATASLYSEIDTELGAAKTDIAAADTALASLVAPQAAVVTALGKVTTWLTGSPSAGTLLAQIATDKTYLRDGANTAVGAGVTANGLVTTADFANAIGVWADEVKHILTTGGIPNMEDLIELGDDLINTVNIGADAAQTYAQYATTVVNMQRAWAQKRADFIQQAGMRLNQVQAYSQEASVRMDMLRSYIEQARAYGVISDGFIAEANQWIGSCNIYLGEANQRTASANAYISEAGMKLYQIDRYLGEADRYIAMSQQRNTEADGRIATCNAYIGEASQRLAIMAAFSTESMYRISEIDRYIEEATRYTDSANASMLLADKFRADGIEKRNEAWSIWSDKKALTGNLAQITNRQGVR